jgi:hypothetical protein
MTVQGRLVLSVDEVARDIDSPRISYVRLQVSQDCLTQPQRVLFPTRSLVLTTFFPTL